MRGSSHNIAAQVSTSISYLRSTYFFFHDTISRSLKRCMSAVVALVSAACPFCIRWRSIVLQEEKHVFEQVLLVHSLSIIRFSLVSDSPFFFSESNTFSLSRRIKFATICKRRALMVLNMASPKKGLGLEISGSPRGTS